MQPSAPALVSGIPFLGLLASMAMLPVLAPWFLASADRSGGAPPGYPYEHIGSAVFIPDDGDAIPRTSSGRRTLPLGGSPMLGTSEPAVPPIPVAGRHDQHGAVTGSANAEVRGAPPTDGLARGPTAGFAGEIDPSRSSPEQWLAGYLRPNIGETIRAWNALSDSRSTLATLEAASDAADK